MQFFLETIGVHPFSTFAHGRRPINSSPMTLKK
jgi:hypothetical protein